VTDTDASLERLVRKAQLRDHEAFVALAEILRPRLWARALRYSPAARDAEDLVQETLLRAYRNLPQLKDPRTIASWILTILDRHAQRELPTRERHAGDELEDISDAAAARIILETNDWPELGSDVNAAVAGLDSDDRELLALRFGGGLNAPEIAKELKTTPAAVRTRLCRALMRLRQMLGVKNHGA
jgi:RNA polymerase sigma-70 factor, ECF subfamily